MSGSDATIADTPPAPADFLSQSTIAQEASSLLSKISLLSSAASASDKGSTIDGFDLGRGGRHEPAKLNSKPGLACIPFAVLQP